MRSGRCWRCGRCSGSGRGLSRRRRWEGALVVVEVWGGLGGTHVIKQAAKHSQNVAARVSRPVAPATTRMHDRKPLSAAKLAKMKAMKKNTHPKRHM